MKGRNKIFKFKTFKAHAKNLCESAYLLEQLTGQNFLLASLVTCLYLLHSSLTWIQCCLLLISLPRNCKMWDSNNTSHMHYTCTQRNLFKRLTAKLKCESWSILSTGSTQGFLVGFGLGFCWLFWGFVYLFGGFVLVLFCFLF